MLEAVLAFFSAAKVGSGSSVTFNDLLDVNCTYAHSLSDGLAIGTKISFRLRNHGMNGGL